MKQDRRRKRRYKRKKVSFFKKHRLKRRTKIDFDLYGMVSKFSLKGFISLLVWAFKIAVTCLIAFVFVLYLGQRVSTVGDSMSPVLTNGDVVLVNRIVYNMSSPKRGDIVVFKPNGNENSHYYIKRIVGLPGETVEIIENHIYINGEKIEEDYTTTDIDDVGVAGEKIKLGGDEYFVLGDDRENSEDSRSADVGNVKRDYIYGKAWFVVSSKEHFGFLK